MAGNRWLVHGELLTVVEIARKYNLSDTVVATRVRRIAKEDLKSCHITAPVRKAKTYVSVSRGGVAGCKTAKEWAEEYGLDLGTAYARLEKGTSLSDRLASVGKTITFAGKSMFLYQWASLWNIDSKKLSYLLGPRRRLSMQEVFDRYAV